MTRQPKDSANVEEFLRELLLGNIVDRVAELEEYFGTEADAALMGVIDRVAPGGCPPGAPTDPDVHL
jgi:hypothetical protein